MEYITAFVVTKMSMKNGVMKRPVVGSTEFYATVGDARAAAARAEAALNGESCVHVIENVEIPVRKRELINWINTTIRSASGLESFSRSTTSTRRIASAVDKDGSQEIHEMHSSEKEDSTCHENMVWDEDQIWDGVD